jgi:hypothetical protein
MADNEREQRIRERAYRIWQEEGEPQGRDSIHYALAEAFERDGSDNGLRRQDKQQGDLVDENAGTINKVRSPNWCVAFPYSSGRTA